MQTTAEMCAKRRLIFNQGWKSITGPVNTE